MSKKTLNEFEIHKNIYIDNIINQEEPFVPAYYFYCQHATTIELLSLKDFKKAFALACSEMYNPISEETIDAFIDIEEVHRILVNYFDICFLFDANNVLVKVY